jgi:hypothetical protein
MELVPYKYCNPYSQDSDFKSFIIQGEYIKITQEKEKGIGLTFWDSVKLEYII